jgi:hypothetical protein
MQNNTPESYTLITGRFETGSPQQKDVITRIVRTWGVHLPPLPHLMVDDPYRHGVSTVGY